MVPFGCVTLQWGKCNFNLRTLGILNLLALGALGAGIGFWNQGISQGIASLQGALGAGSGIGNFGILGLQGALGAGSGIGNFGILGLQRALGAAIGIGNFGILGLQGALGAGIGIGNLAALRALGAGYGACGAALRASGSERFPNQSAPLLRSSLRRVEQL